MKCITGHIPLTWIKHTSGKGPVSQFILDNLGKIDYELHYRPGKQLVEVDALSRYPCLGPKRLSKGSMNEAVNTLLHAPPKDLRMHKRLWVNTGKETMLSRETMMHMQTTLNLSGEARRVPITDRPTAAKVDQIDYSLAVLAPPSESCTEVPKQTLSKSNKAAILTPLSLITKCNLNNTQKANLRKAAKHPYSVRARTGVDNS